MSKCRFLPPLCYPLARHIPIARHIGKSRFCPVKETIILRCWTARSRGVELLITDLDLIASLPLTLQPVVAGEHTHDLNLAALVVPLDAVFQWTADTILLHLRLTCCKRGKSKSQ
jgi:hypothetical protein